MALEKTHRFLLIDLRHLLQFGTACTWIHCRSRHELSGISEREYGQGNGNLSIFHGLAHNLKHIFLKFRQPV